MTTKKEKEIKKQEKELKRKQKTQEKEKRRKERRESKAAEREAMLKAFKSISNIGEAIAFVLVYGKNTVLVLASFVLGYLFRHYGLFSAIFKKIGLITEVVK